MFNFLSSPFPTETNQYKNDMHFLTSSSQQLQFLLFLLWSALGCTTTQNRSNSAVDTSESVKYMENKGCIKHMVVQVSMVSTNEDCCFLFVTFYDIRVLPCPVAIVGQGFEWSSSNPVKHKGYGEILICVRVTMGTSCVP